MPIQRTYRKEGEGGIASYDWTDIAEGTGLVTFYGCSDAISGATTYSLINNSSIYSDSAALELVRDTEGSTTISFDTPKFNLPRIVKGTAYFSAAFRIDTTPGQTYLRLQLNKLNGSVATPISSFIKSSQKYFSVADNGMYFVKMPISGANVIKAGEQIRLTLELTRGGAGIAAVAFDPANRDAAYITPSTQPKLTSRMRVFIPFRIDI